MKRCGQPKPLLEPERKSKNQIVLRRRSMNYSTRSGVQPAAALAAPRWKAMAEQQWRDLRAWALRLRIICFACYAVASPRAPHMPLISQPRSVTESRPRACGAFSASAHVLQHRSFSVLHIGCSFSALSLATAND